MKNILQILTLVGLFALWGQAKAYEVVIDIEIEQQSLLRQDNQGQYQLQETPILSGTAYSLVDGVKTPISLQLLNVLSPDSKNMSAEEWAMEWLGEVAPDLIASVGAGLDLDLIETEVEMRRQKLKCRGKDNIQCRGELSVKLTVRRF